MKKYPFGVIKRDALRLLKGKWNAVVLALFFPFLCYTAFAVKLSQAVEDVTSTIQLESYFLWQTVVTLCFCVVMELISVGMYRNLQPTREKASCLNIYLEAVKSSFRLLPVLCIKYLVPMVSGWLFAPENIDLFYDYLMFSLLDYQIYLIVAELVWLAVEIFGCYLSLSLLLAPCILANHPEYGVIRLVKESFFYARENRWYLVWLTISFVGWLLLGSLAFTIGILWAMAYLMTAYFTFYRRIAFEREAVPEIPEEL